MNNQPFTSIILAKTSMILKNFRITYSRCLNSSTGESIQTVQLRIIFQPLYMNKMSLLLKKLLEIDKPDWKAGQNLRSKCFKETYQKNLLLRQIKLGVPLLKTPLFCNLFPHSNGFVAELKTFWSRYANS